MGNIFYNTISAGNVISFLFLKTMQNGDKDSIKDFLQYDLKLNKYDIGSTKEEDFTKVSISANLTKIYHHTFYPVEIDTLSSALNTDKKNYYQW